MNNFLSRIFSRGRRQGPSPLQVLSDSVHEIAEMNLLVLSLDCLLHCVVKGHSCSFIVRGEAMYGLDFGRIGVSIENNREITFIMPPISITDVRVNYESKYGPGIEFWDKGNVTASEQYTINKVIESKSQEEIKHRAMKDVYVDLAKEQAKQVLLAFLDKKDADRAKFRFRS